MKNMKKILSFLMVFVILATTCVNAFATEYSENIVPTMVNNTTASTGATGYKASASSIYNAAHDAYRAFLSANDTNGSCYASVENVSSAWLRFEFPEAVNVSQYTMLCQIYGYGYGPSSAPRNWTFEGSNDGLSWTVLDTQSEQTDWSIGTKRVYSFNNNALYRIYRINMTKNNGCTYFAIGKLEMMSASNIIPVSSVSIDKTNLDLLVGESGLITATVLPEDATNKNVLWNSSDTSIATVAGGNVVGIKEGVATITATTEDGQYSATCIVNVTAPITSRANLVITLVNGKIIEYDMSSNEINTFLKWIDDKSQGEGKAYFVFNKTGSVKPYKSIKEYVFFDKILDLAIKEYENYQIDLVPDN